MIKKLKYIFTALLFSLIHSQFFYSPIDLGTAGASFSGNLGTHSLQTNPAFLGIKSGDALASTPYDTFKISYRVRLIESEDKNKIKQIKTNLLRDGLDREYKISKEDKIFALDAPGFEDSFSAHNFSRNLPSTLSNYIILADTINEVIYKKKYNFRIQLFATDIKDSLKTFIKRTKPLIKGLKRTVTLKDSMYRFSVGSFEYQQEALIMKDSLIADGLSPDAFITKEELQSSSLSAPKVSISIPFSHAFSLSNNLFSASWLNTFLSADMVEQPILKESLLKSIPSKGLAANFIINASIFDLTYRNFGLSLFNTSLFSNFILPKSIFELIFDGIKFEDPVDISDFDSKAYIVNSSSFSYGKSFEHEAIPFETYIGLGIRFLTGSFAYLDSFSGELMTTSDSIYFSYEQALVNSDFNSGNGYGVDLGILCNVDERISGQISFIGLGSSLKSNVPIQYTAQEIKLSNKEIEDFDPEDKAWTTLDSTIFKDIKVDIPAKLNLGLTYIYSEKIHLKTSMRHLMQTKFIGLVSPRFSLGFEFLPKTTFPIRAGISLGGINNAPIVGMGFGIHKGIFDFNFGMNQSGGVFNKAEGISIGSELRLLF